jgi:hypothetical protein
MIMRDTCTPIWSMTRDLKRSLARRYGEISNMSILFPAICCSILSHSSLLSELIVAAVTPMRCAAAIWFRMGEIRGDINSAGPLPACRSSLVAMKYTKLLPQPVF